MNETILANWNAKVQPNDIIYHLGDVCMGQKELWPKFVSRLNGYKILIRGNHDKSPQYMLDLGFQEVYDSLKIKYKDKTLFLNHIPLLDNEDPDYDIGLCGHIPEKGSIMTDTKGRKVYNVGMDNPLHEKTYSPLTLDEVLAKVNT